MSEHVATIPLPATRDDEHRRLVLQRIQPALIGLIDGTISTLAPISMGLSEGLSDDGSVTGRGSSLSRGLITGGATFVGGTFHALPFLISDVTTALAVAYVVVAVELVTIAPVRRPFM